MSFEKQNNGNIPTWKLIKEAEQAVVDRRNNLYKEIVDPVQLEFTTALLGHLNVAVAMVEKGELHTAYLESEEVHSLAIDALMSRLTGERAHTDIEQTNDIKKCYPKLTVSDIEKAIEFRKLEAEELGDELAKKNFDELIAHFT